MIDAHLGLHFLISLGLLGGGGLTALVNPIEPNANPPIASVSETSFTTHTEPDAFVIQYPQGWQVTSLGEDTIEIVSASDDDLTMTIHTQVKLLREDPDAVINRSIDQFIADQVRVGRYSMVSVDNQQALRIWMSVSDEIQMIATFVGYGKAQTAVLTSQYSPSQSDAETTILHIHDSFVNTGVATAVE